MKPQHIAGRPELTAHTQPWMDQLLSNPELCGKLIAAYGSPLNVHNFAPLADHVNELRQVAKQRHIDFEIYVARKANKTHGLIHAAHNSNTGVDVASKRELEQCLKLGFPSAKIIMSAATKTQAAIDAALTAQTTISIDNEDELTLVNSRAKILGAIAHLALRIAIVNNSIAPSRFGLAPSRWLELAKNALEYPHIQIDGVHFHLNGYAASERAIGLRQSLELIDNLQALGHRPTFIDIGGGMPMSYLKSQKQWQDFWQALADSQTNRAAEAPITWKSDLLGLVDPSLDRPSPATYPYYQAITRGEWLAQILDEKGLTAHTTIAEELSSRRIQLRCEPGRAMLDGCGLTLAEVAFRKTTPQGTNLVGLYMNRTQVRSTSADFLVDPLLVTVDVGCDNRVNSDSAISTDSAQPIANTQSPRQGTLPAFSGAFLVGSYCIEDELILKRAFDFPRGVSVGDIIAFPNTGGYLMHILESASHQLPLAANVVALPESDYSTKTQPVAPALVAGWVQDAGDLINPAGGERLR